MLKYMYIDESGDLGQQSKHLVISALVVDDPADLEKIVKRMRRYKFKKELKKASEIKANKSSKAIRCHMLEKLSGVKGARVFHIVLKKRSVHSQFLKGDKNKLYNFVAGKLAEQIVLNDLDLEVRVDRSKGKQVLRADFNKYFEAKLREKSSIRRMEIHHSYSHAWVGLQFADILAWSAFQHVEHNNSEFLDMVEVPQEKNQVWEEK